MTSRFVRDVSIFNKRPTDPFRTIILYFKEAGDVDKTFFWPIIIQRTKVFLEAYAIPSQKTHRKMGVHVLVSMVTEQIY